MYIVILRMGGASHGNTSKCPKLWTNRRREQDGENQKKRISYFHLIARWNKRLMVNFVVANKNKFTLHWPAEREKENISFQLLIFLIQAKGKRHSWIKGIQWRRNKSGENTRERILRDTKRKKLDLCSKGHIYIGWWFTRHWYISECVGGIYNDLTGMQRYLLHAPYLIF